MPSRGKVGYSEWKATASYSVSGTLTAKGDTSNGLFYYRGTNPATATYSYNATATQASGYSCKTTDYTAQGALDVQLDVHFTPKDGEESLTLGLGYANVTLKPVGRKAERGDCTAFDGVLRRVLGDCMVKGPCAEIPHAGGTRTISRRYEDKESGMIIDYEGTLTLQPEFLACPVGPPDPLTDGQAIRMEEGSTIQWEGPAEVQAKLRLLKEAYDRLKTRLPKGWTVTVTSAYRPLDYQWHLFEIADKLKQFASFTDDARYGCAPVLHTLLQEKAKHKLGDTVWPPSESAPHVRGAAFDAVVANEKGERMNGPWGIDARIVEAAYRTGLRVPFPLKDPYGFELIDGTARLLKEPDVGVLVSGRPVPEPEVVIVQDRSLLPLRKVAEALGAEVEWVQEWFLARVIKGDREVQLHPGSSEATLIIGSQSQGIKLEVPAMLLEDRLRVPVRFIADALGVAISWDEESRTIIVGSQASP